MTFRRIGYVALQLSWGILQNLFGLAVFLLYAKREHYFYGGAIVTQWDRDSCMGTGMFIFMSEECGDGYSDILAHEYGHTIQSIILGPLFLPVIGLPSVLWFSLPFLRRWRTEKGISYYSFYTESWANKLGKVGE